MTMGSFRKYTKDEQKCDACMMHHVGFPMRSALNIGKCYKIVHGGSREIGFI